MAKKSDRSQIASNSDRDQPKFVYMESDSFHQVQQYYNINIIRDDENNTETFGNLTETSAYYTFHRILSSKSYTLGKVRFILI